MPTDAITEQKARAAFAENPFPQTPFVTVTEDGIVIATGYSEALHRLLRWVPKAKWRASERSWLVPFSGADAVRAVLPEISRLADAARELDEAAPAGDVRRTETDADRLARLVEAAELLHGSDWRAALVRDHPEKPIADWIEGKLGLDPSDGIFADLAARLRRKAEASRLAADRLEALVKATPGR